MATQTASNPPATQHPLLNWLFSSLGKKIVVALTGIVLVLFVIGHLVGNFTFFLGPDAINSYAMQLRALGPLLWIARIVLLAAVTIHIASAFVLCVAWHEIYERMRQRCTLLCESHV